MLTFDAATHTYRWDDRVVPSVTQVIRESGLYDASWYKPEDALRGTYVHDACRFADENDLGSVDPRIQGYVDAWLKFKRESGFSCQPGGIERMFVNEAYGYAGTIDRDCKLGPADATLDIKTGQPAAWHAIQTAAYRQGSHSMALRVCVYLSDDGRYKLVRHTDTNDFNVFLAALAVRNWKHNKGLIK